MIMELPSFAQWSDVFFHRETILKYHHLSRVGNPKLKMWFYPSFLKKATGVPKVTRLPGNLGWLVQLNNEPTPSIDPWKGEISCRAWGNSLEIVVHENQDAKPQCNWPLIWFDMHVLQHSHLIVYRLPPNGNTYQTQ